MNNQKWLLLSLAALLMALFLMGYSVSAAAPATAALAETATPPPVPATATPTPPKNSMGVWGSSGSDVFAVGCQGKAVSGNCIAPPGMILHYDGRAWSPMTTPATDWLSTVWGTSGSDVFAAGHGGTILHYDGKAWSPMDSGTDQTLYGVWGSSGQDVFAVGSGGTILHYDGSAWSPMPSGINTDLNWVWGSSGRDVFATGDIGAILHYDGRAWSPMKSGTYNPVLGVWGSSGRDVFAVGEGGVILHYDGSAWSPMKSGTFYYLESVWGSSGSDIFAVGSRGTILHYDGKAWSPMSSGTPRGFESVWGSSGSDIFAVGEADTILHYDGSAWSDMSSGALAKTPSALEEALAGKYKGKSVTLRASWQMFPPIDFEEKTGIDVHTLSATSDFEADDSLAQMIEAGDGPDIYEFYMPTNLRELARQGKVVDVSKFLDSEMLQARYGPEWLDWATMPGPDGPIMAGVWAEGYVNSLVWYPRAAFDQAGYKVPTTWEELLALSDQIVKDGGTPWCIENGFWGGTTVGATAAHWVNDIMLRTAPLEDYDQWVKGELKFSSPQVKHAVEVMSDLWFKPGYSYVSREKLNSTFNSDVIKPMLATPPKCWLLKEPNWLIADEAGAKQLGKDYAFFVLPPIDPAYGAPVQVDSHFIAMFNDRPEVRALMEYFTTKEQVEGWTKLGKLGFSPHKEVRLDWYREDLDRAVAEVLQNAPSVRYWAGDAMPLVVDNQIQKSLADYVAGAIDLDTALKQVDDVWLASVPEQAAVTPAPTATPEPPDTILFIGNSLTFANNGVYNHLEQLAASANPPRVITADEAMMGGATLKTLWELSMARDLIGKGIFDVVVLQEDIPEADPATGVDTFHKYVRQFDAGIKKVGARPLLFMAWPYERLGWITMDEIAQAHRDIATELGIEVAPVGLAFQRAMKERPDLDMYDYDGEHPSIYGTYLATNVIYATVFGESPSGLPYLPPKGLYMLSNGGSTRGITEEEAAFLQRVAWETVQEYQAQQ